ncbi:polysaccharide pyruvyl transferase family protein [Mucilaginibacter litoreus]|uniref:Polysaccharide pyruvyl transferase family protein n=1 Tax=Mucilaginibacter litoreus TaxID=1048221 RepID=A0ABW3AV53_9SPHI
MIVELRGVEFHNKGAELMLFAILEQVKKRFPDTIFVMEKTKNAPIHKQREVGIYTKFEIEKIRNRGIAIGKLMGLVPKAIRRNKGYILESEIDVVLDGSGFAYGDYWGYKNAKYRLSSKIVKWRKEGKKVIVLPQAFGKFEDKNIQREMKIIIENANLIFARDEYSLKYLRGVKVNDANTFLKPDFTNLITGVVPATFDADTMEVAIIPNNKVVESGVFASRQEYIDFLNNLCKIIKEKGKKPFFLIHEGVKDLRLAEAVNEQYNADVKILIEDNSLHVKGIIGKSQAVITSRFHGLVSALAQAVPCLCVGWSHKYEALMQDYNYADGLIGKKDFETDNLKNKINMILEDTSRNKIIENLKAMSAKQKELSKQMWNQVFEVLEK